MKPHLDEAISGRPSIPGEEIAVWLRSSPDYVVLRNTDFETHLRNGGDIDVVVGNMQGALSSLIERFGRPLGISKWSYVSGCYWPWGLIDLVPRIEWHGAEYVPIADLVRVAVTNERGFRQAHPVHEALICWFAKLMWGATFKESYRKTIVGVADSHPDEFLEVLQYAVGREWGRRLFEMARAGRPEEAVTHVRSLRVALWSRSFRREPVVTLRCWAEHWVAWFRVHMEPPLPWVGFLGLDGSGKTSVISELTDLFEKEYWIRGVRVGHWRPGVLRKTLGNVGPVTDPHGGLPRGLLASTGKLAFLVLDWRLGYWGDLVRFRREWVWLVFDRPFVDVFVDPKRYRYGGPIWLARLVGHLIPRPDLLILLDLPAERALQRKPEIELGEAARLRERYLTLARSLRNGCVIDADRPLNEVVADVEAAIMEFTTKRTRRRLCTRKASNSDARAAELCREPPLQ